MNSKKFHSNSAFFIPFPKPSTNRQKCEAWVHAVNQPNITVESIGRHHYVCSNHFVGGKGPTSDFPDPLPNIKTVTVNKNAVYLDHVYAQCKLSEIKKEPVFVECTPDFIGDSTGLATNVLQFWCVGDHPTTNAITEASEEFLSFKDSPKLEKAKKEVLEDFEFKQISEEVSSIKEEVLPVQEIEFRDFEQQTSPIMSVKHTGTSPMTFKDFPILSIDMLARDMLIYQSDFYNSFYWYVKRQQGLDKPETTGLCMEKSCGNSFYINLVLSIDMELSVTACDKRLNIENDQFSELKDRLQFPVKAQSDLLEVISLIDQFRVCEGINGATFANMYEEKSKKQTVCPFTKNIRAKDCYLLFKGKRSNTNLCEKCRIRKKVLQRVERNRKDRVHMPKKFEFLSKPQIHQQMKSLRLKNKTLNRRVQRLENNIKRNLFRNETFKSNEQSQELQEVLQENAFEIPRTLKKKMVC